jgi:hypothetical protein
MTLLDSMGTLAELSITVVGFTGVVIALRTGSAEPLRATVMNMLFGFGFAGVVWAMLPPILLGAGVDERLVWRALSMAFVATMIVMGTIRRRQARHLGASWDQIGVTVPILSACQFCILGLDIYSASPSLFLAALLSNLSIGLVLFWQLIAPGDGLLRGVRSESA